jgi:hypothetical protein
MIKNQSFLKSQEKDAAAAASIKQTTDFYNTIFKNIQTGKLGVGANSQGLNLKPHPPHPGSRLSDSKKQTMAPTTSKTTRLSSNLIKPNSTTSLNQPAHNSNSSS